MLPPTHLCAPLPALVPTPRIPLFPTAPQTPSSSHPPCPRLLSYVLFVTLFRHSQAPVVLEVRITRWCADPELRARNDPLLPSPRTSAPPPPAGRGPLEPASGGSVPQPPSRLDAYTDGLAANGGGGLSDSRRSCGMAGCLGRSVAQGAGNLVDTLSDACERVNVCSGTAMRQDMAGGAPNAAR